MKLIPGVDLTNVLRADMWRSQKHKKTIKCVKAARNLLVKLIPEVNFIYVLRTAFTLTDPESMKRYWWLDCIFLRFWDLWASKLHVKCWWNWYLISIILAVVMRIDSVRTLPIFEAKAGLVTFCDPMPVCINDVKMSKNLRSSKKWMPFTLNIDEVAT